MTPQVRASARAAHRLRTRQQVLDAAISEYKRDGMTRAQVSAIVEAAGVAHGTFYFHFPTKEHVMLELERDEEVRMARELARFLESRRELGDVLGEVVRLLIDLEQRLGRALFRELLGLHFSPSRPVPDDWTDHPVIVLLVREIERVRGDGGIHPEVDAFYSAVFFLVGVYGVLGAAGEFTPSDAMLDEFVASAVRGLEIR